MNRIDQRFAALAAEARCGLIPFVTAGDPSVAATVPVLHALVEAGADLIEIGVPFSDPMADGPVIQRASERALARGVGLRTVLGMVAEFRTGDAQTPIILMGYLNPFERDPAAVFRDCARAGVDGVLMVDCPIEESDMLRERLDASGLHQIFLAAPTTTPERVQAMRKRAAGFVYCVAFAGVTGADGIAYDQLAERTASLGAALGVPVAVGFGIKRPDDAVRIAAGADAVVIGSALVEAIAESEDESSAAARASAFLAPFRTALDAARSGLHVD